MKFLKSNNVSDKSVWTSILLLGFVTIVIGLFSCSDDNEDVITDGTESESGFLYSYRFETDQGRLWYMSAHPEIPAEPDVENSVELGFNADIYSYGEHVYTWNGDASTITKWKVDKATFEITPVGLLSFARTGLSGFAPFPLFISETRAFTTWLNEGIVIEWNPSAMEIIENYNVEPNPVVNLVPTGFTDDLSKYLRNNKLFMPIRYNELSECCDFDDTDGAIVGVLDLNTKTIEYVRDNRLLATDGFFAVDENDNLYAKPRFTYWVKEYFDVDTTTLPNQFTLLKFNDDGTFDPNFELNLEELIPSENIEVSFVFENKVVITYTDTTYTLPPNWDDRLTLFDQDIFGASIDLTTREVRPFTAFDNYLFIIPWTVIDGTQYFLAFKDSEALIVRQDALEEYTEVSRISNGSFRTIARLWGSE